jgi:acyl carrier protein
MPKNTRLPASAEQLRESLIAIVARIANIDVRDLGNDVLIREELGIDSLKAMEIVAVCEKQMEIAIDEGQLFDIKTVGDFFDLLEGLYSSK